jgi:pyridoxine 5-phosphate synthase
MTRLSVNINKVALLRNSRRGNFPDLYQFAIDCEQYGAQGITVHPRPDQRHIRMDDIPILKQMLQTELNIEGYPSKEFIYMVLVNKPAQCTLVPDGADVLTSEEGWDIKANRSNLKEVCDTLRSAGIRSSIFIDPDPAQIEYAHEVGTDCIELYTGKYAHQYSIDPEVAINDHVKTATLAMQAGILINAGHDLNKSNLKFYKSQIPQLHEVSIGHALIADSLYYGIENTIQMYLQFLKV